MSRSNTKTVLIRKPSNTVSVFEAHTNLVDLVRMAPKGKYPNGLADIIKARGISQAKLAEAIGTSQQQIGKLVNGEREMTALWAEKLAPALRASPEQLVFPGLRRFRAPLVSWVSAGQLAAQEGVKRTDVKKYVMLADLPKGDWIVLEVQGDSMDRVAPDGSYICVNLADRRPHNEKFFVFCTEEGDATFKRFRAGNPPRLQPFSTNPDHETLPMTEGMLVVGRVGRVIHDLD
ncbi:LexA family protein [Rhodopseudomonas telluris]|uniref:LexA family protein n=1 Tax=Rhodopseudomonas telluris TaxID=644215 RepID=A0ABV6EZI1_9BRAD